MTDSMTLTTAVGVIAAFLISVLWAYLAKVVPVLIAKWRADMNETQLHQIDDLVREAVVMAQQIGVRDGLTNSAKKLLAESHVQSELDRLGIPIDAAIVANKIEAEVGSQHWGKIFEVKTNELASAALVSTLR